MFHSQFQFCRFFRAITYWSIAFRESSRFFLGWFTRYVFLSLHIYLHTMKWSASYLHFLDLSLTYPFQAVIASLLFHLVANDNLLTNFLNFSISKSWHSSVPFASFEKVNLLFQAGLDNSIQTEKHFHISFTHFAGTYPLYSTIFLDLRLPSNII